MPYIIKLKQIKRRDNLIISFIIDYNGLYIHSNEVITKMLFSLLKTFLKPFLLNNEPDIKFFLILAICSILLRVRSSLEVIFSMIFSTLSTLEVDKYLTNKFSLSIFFVSGTSFFLNTYISYCTNINPSLLKTFN